MGNLNIVSITQSFLTKFFIWSCINTIPAKLAELIYSRLTLLFKTLPGYKLIMNNNHEIMQVAQVRLTRE